MERIWRLETWARLGYAARGIVYVILGWIALSSGKALSTRETLGEIYELPGGVPLLVVLTLGLFGYGLYKVYTAALDLDDDGHHAKGTVKRIARAIGGLVYWGLAFLAGKQIFSGGDAATGSGRATGAAATVGGDTVMVLAGVVVLGIAASQFVIAFRAKFMAEMPRAPQLVKPAGQVGYAARAIIVAMVGYFAVRAGIDGERVRNFGDALAVVRDGHEALFKLIAAGLMLFGIVSLMMARYRRIADDDVVARLKDQVAPLGH
jgi:Domain of Unknown Function (DUF1206)